MLLNFTDFGPNKYDTSIQLKCCNYITVFLLRRQLQRMLKRKLKHNFDWTLFLEPRTSFCFVFCKKLTNPSFLRLSIQHQMASRLKKRLILGFSHKNKFWLDYFLQELARPPTSKLWTTFAEIWTKVTFPWIPPARMSKESLTHCE